ncbi:ATP-binding cassette domain-containing protein [Gracilibacillus oryzae]|uniref:ATP-binding cassette domain-containing protein n=1 Tax=Gracilibacillus oryzae TaxID=1672701 RepID=A0A7C8GR64_9BACI|nr:ATP-binding cassette domain-containing protein [Gracilibacillus oryzae]KAB8127093.1 ATP-binding cassette domain-containing protein [Gracilibacillus oryzae]
MIKLVNLTKKYGSKTAVDHLDLVLTPGAVTGFLGPNGSGKSTTMKMIISLVRPTLGEVVVDGKAYRDFPEPIKRIGTLIDPSALDKNLTAKQHLSIIATAANINPQQVEEMLRVTGLENAQNKKVKSYSLGMKQRLGIATALLGNPDTVILDEPFNGMDVDGIKWLRGLFKQLAKSGKSVLVSSHLMSEIQAVADRVVIIGQGKLLAHMTMDELKRRSLSSFIYVEANNLEKIKRVLLEKQAIVQHRKAGLEVRNLDAKEIGELALENQIVLHELTKVTPSLEDVFTEITDGKADYISKEVNMDETLN